MVLLEVEEIAVGDYSDEYGTVKFVKDLGATVHLIFMNGTELYPTKGTEMNVTQGGRFEHGSERRPG